MVELFGRETRGGEDARRRGRVVYMMPPLCERSECKGKEGGCFRRLLQTCVDHSQSVITSYHIIRSSYPLGAKLRACGSGGEWKSWYTEIITSHCGSSKSRCKQDAEFSPN